jgi:hypothetical protein
VRRKWPRDSMVVAALNMNLQGCRMEMFLACMKLRAGGSLHVSRTGPVWPPVLEHLSVFPTLCLGHDCDPTWPSQLLRLFRP